MMEPPGRRQQGKPRRRSMDMLRDVDSWCERRRCRGQVKMDDDDLLWQLLEKVR